MSSKKDDHSVTWDGNITTWAEYVKRVRLQYERTPVNKRKLLGADLVSRLTGRAWQVASSEIDHYQLQKKTGPAYLLSFLEKRLCKTPIPETGQRLEDLFIRMRRSPGTSMSEWASHVREQYRHLQRAMARTRPVKLKSEASVKSPLGSRGFASPMSLHTPRRLSLATEPEPHTENTPPAVDAPGDGEASAAAEGEEPVWRAQEWSEEEWRAWRSWKGWQGGRSPGRSHHGDSDSSESEAEIQWDQFDSFQIHEDLLPPEILGWLLLRRARLPAASRLSILAAVGNRLDFESIERAMRDQEEELIAAEGGKGTHDWNRSRRTFWVEDNGQWGLLTDPDDAEVVEGNIHWVGDRLPDDVYANEESCDTWVSYTPDGHPVEWQWWDDDFYTCDEQGVYWSWSETKQMQDVDLCYWADPENNKSLSETYSAVQQKVRTFKEARQLTKAKGLSRGFYPMSSFGNKGKSSKGKKGFGKGSKGKPSVLAAQRPESKGGSGQKPGEPGYTGCFICGSPDHDFRNCPKRGQRPAGQPGGSKGSYYATAFMIDEGTLPQAILANDSQVPEVPVLVAQDEDDAMIGVQESVLGTLQKMYPGFAVLDTGATETVASLEAIDEVMRRRREKYPNEQVLVHPERHRAFRFGNGQSRTAESYVEIPQLLDGKEVRLGVHTLDVPEVPVLVSIQTMRKLGAVISTAGDFVVFEKVNPNVQVPLVQSRSGHLLLDLTTDWMSAGLANGQDSMANSRAYMEPRQLQQLFPCQQDDNLQTTCQDELEGCDNEQTGMLQNTSENQASGSSMRLPSFLTLTSFACVNLATHGSQGVVAAAISARDSFHGNSQDTSEGQGEGKEQNIGKSPICGTVRSEPGGRTRSPRSSNSGIPLLGKPCANETRKGESFRSQQAWSMGGVREVSSKDQLHPDSGQSWTLSSGRSFERRHHQGPGEDQPRDDGATRGEGETQCTTGGIGWCRGIPEEALGGSAAQERHHDSERSSFGIISWNNSQHREDWHTGRLHGDLRDQEAAEEGEPGAGRDPRGQLGTCRSDSGLEEDRLLEMSKEKVKWLTHGLQEWQQDVEEAYVNMPRSKKYKYDLLELCCPEDSTLSQVVMDRGGKAHRCGLPYYDMLTQLGGDRVLQALDELEPRLLWVSVKCGPWSPLQRLFNENTEEKYKASMMRKRKGRKMVRQAIRAMRKQIESGRHMAWEWPTGCEGWQLPELRIFFHHLTQQGLLFTARLDGCMVNVTDDEGNLMRKPWTIKTTDEELAKILSRKCNHTYKHQECVGKNRAEKSGFYPKPMCELIAKHLLGNHWGQAGGIFPVLPGTPEDEEQKKDNLDDPAAKKPKLEPPLTEKERKEAFRVVHKLHKRSGHPSNRALAACLQRRGAHPEVVKIAAEHRCNECQELHLPTPSQGLNLQKSEVLWETMTMDGIDMKVDGMMVHGIVMMDEASHFAVIAEIFRRQLDEGRNTTGQEAVACIEKFWVQYFGWPSKIRLDPEGAFRSAELSQWAEERGIEILPCVAEAHHQIGDVEGLIGKIKQSMRMVLQEQPECDPMSAAQQVIAAHNSIERVQGYAPNQWVFGRDKTMTGRLFEGGNDIPPLQSMGTAQTAMNKNLRLRVTAEQAYRKSQAQGQISRAFNLKTRPLQQFLPGDLVYFKRVKVPAQPAAQVRMGHRLWSWYGPGRVLASETRTDAGGTERKPSHVIWVVSCGRLKRCSPEQLRHASEVEKAVAETTTGAATSWTFHRLMHDVQKGQFEALDERTFPEDRDLRVPARGRSRTPVRTSGERGQRSRTPTSHLPVKTPKEKTSQEVQHGDPGGLEAPMEAGPRNKTSQEIAKRGLVGNEAPTEANPRKKIPKTEEERDTVGSKNVGTPNPEDSVPISGERYLREPRYVPKAMESPSGELLEQPLFKKQRQALQQLEGQARSSDDQAMMVTDTAESLFCVSFFLDLPKTDKEWKQMKRDPEAFYVKKTKGAEVKWHKLDSNEKIRFDEAKQAEISQWLKQSAVKRVKGEVDPARVIRMRWILTYKQETGKAKARLVLIGYEDPDLANLNKAAPTMGRRTRQNFLQYSSIRKWRNLKADVRAAFLQGGAVEEPRQLYAWPVPELAAALDIPEHQAVQVSKSCYGLVSAPSSWFQHVNATVKELGMTQSVTDPCLWFLYEDSENVDEERKEVLGMMCSHVDDFLIAGNEESEKWCSFLQGFHGRYQWSPWEHGEFFHCGVKLREAPGYAIEVDHTKFCEDLDQINFRNRPDDEPATPDEITQLRGVLGAAQWRAYQSGPHHSAKLGILQSMVTKATVETLKIANKLVREIHQQKFLSTKISHLPLEDPKDACFIAWSDAALANRPDLSSTGGYMIGVTTPNMLKGETSPITFVSWRSGKLARKARSSLAAEIQACADAEEELMYCRLQWAEMCGFQINLRKPLSSVRKISGTVVVDAKSLYDMLIKGDLNSSAGGLKDKYSALEALCLLERIQHGRTEVRWVHSLAQIADGLTKAGQCQQLLKVLHEGRWTLIHDPEFVAAKKLPKNERL